MKVIKSLNLFLFISWISNPVLAQTEDTVLNKTYYDILAFLLLGVVVLILLAFLYFGMDPKKTKERVKVTSSIFQKLKSYIGGMEPMEKEKELMMDHDYDGIKELDNRIPPWFNWLFYGTILFGIYYMLNYHVFKTGKLQIEEYKEEVRIAEIQKAELIRTGALINEETVEYDNSESALSAGKEIYTKNCVPCHGPNGGGTVGPNLTDKYWIHGGGIKNVFKTVKYGVPAKGMVSWENQLNPKQMQNVASYVWSLQGKNPEGGKPPEGNLYKPEQTEEQ